MPSKVNFMKELLVKNGNSINIDIKYQNNDYKWIEYIIHRIYMVNDEIYVDYNLSSDYDKYGGLVNDWRYYTSLLKHMPQKDVIERLVENNF